MSSKLTGKLIPLPAIMEEPVFQILSLRPKYSYIEGKKTDELLGFNYEVVELIDFEKFNIFVPHKKPLIHPEKLVEAREGGSRLYVEFQNATLKQYVRYKNGNIDDICDSFSADDVAFIENN